MKNVFDKVKLLIKCRKRYKCTHCKDTGYVTIKISPLDGRSVNTLGKDAALVSKIVCKYCSK